MSAELDKALARLFNALAALGEKAGKLIDMEITKAAAQNKAYQTQPR